MKDFSNNRAINQHEHAHGISEHDANDGTKTNSRFKHEKGKGNQHKQKKETKEMNRRIKKNITPTLTVFAVSIAIVFSLVINAKASDKSSKFFFAKTFTLENFRADGIYTKTNGIANNKEAFFVKYDVDKSLDFAKDKVECFKEKKFFGYKANSFVGINDKKVWSFKPGWNSSGKADGSFNNFGWDQFTT